MYTTKCHFAFRSEIERQCFNKRNGSYTCTYNEKKTVQVSFSKFSSFNAYTSEIGRRPARNDVSVSVLKVKIYQSASLEMAIKLNYMKNAVFGGFSHALVLSTQCAGNALMTLSVACVKSVETVVSQP